MRADKCGRHVARTLLSFVLWPAVFLNAQAAASAESWVSEYPRLAALAEQECSRPPLDDCRRELLRIAKLLDDRTDIVYRLAKLEAKLGHAEASLRYLNSYARSQLDLGDPATEAEFKEMLAGKDFKRLEEIYRAGLVPTGAHLQVALAPAPDLIAEDLAIDTQSGTRFLSSVHLNKVLALDGAGNWNDYLGPSALSAWGIYALSVDAVRNRLWISSVAGEVSPPFRAEDKGRSAVLRFDLRHRTEERRYELHDGQAHAFGDMALGSQGQLYVADGVGGGVYRIGAAADAALETLVSPGAMRSPQTPVPLPDGKRLLVADYSRGIAVINLKRPNSISWLGHDPELAVYGIDGLYLNGSTLIAVQNGTVPERLLFIQLDRSLSRVLHWRVALARTAGLGDPTHGVVRKNQFEFISNSGWDRVDEQGRFNQNAAASPPAIWSIALPNP